MKAVAKKAAPRSGDRSKHPKTELQERGDQMQARAFARAVAVGTADKQATQQGAPKVQLPKTAPQPMPEAPPKVSANRGDEAEQGILKQREWEKEVASQNSEWTKNQLAGAGKYHAESRADMERQNMAVAAGAAKKDREERAALARR